MTRTLLFAWALGACAPARTPLASELSFVASDGRVQPLLDANRRYTVVEFFSAHCPCQALHDARLNALSARAAAGGLAFRAVDSEDSASPTRDRWEATQRGYTFPILSDPQGSAARAFQAKYATFTVIVERGGRVVYQGGIDSDRSRLHEDRTPYLADALGDLAAGRPISRPTARTLGCSLRLR